MHRPLAARLAVLGAMLLPAAAAAQTDAVPTDQRGLWVPAKSDCKSPLRLELAPKQMTLSNGKDRVSHGNVGMSYFGNSYQGITFAAMPDWDKSQPYVVLLNAEEKKGRAKINFNDARLKKRFPLQNVTLKRCASAVAPAGK